MSEPRPSPELTGALQQLLDRYAASVRSVSARYGFAAPDVDELFQEVRVRLWQALREGKVVGSPASYMYRVACSAAIDLIRRRRRDQRGEPLDPERPGEGASPGVPPTPDAALASGEVLDAVEREIAALEPDRALAVRMYLDGYARQDVMRMLGWSEARTRHLIYRGLEQLRERLVACGITPETIG